MIRISQSIRNVCKRKILMPAVILFVMVMVLIRCPFLQIFHPQKIDNIYDVKMHDGYVNVTAGTLYYSGYNFIKTGQPDYGYYYCLEDERCTFVLIPIEETPAPILYNYNFKAKLIHPNKSYQQMLDAFAKDLNWNDKDLSKVSGEFLLSSADYHPVLYMILLWVVLLILLLALKKLITALIGYFHPVMYPVCTFLGRAVQKELIDEAQEELDSQNYLQINEMYITENYFIDLSKSQVSIIPLSEIVWCYRLGTISFNPRKHQPEYAIYFTILSGAVVTVRHKTSDEALELINAIRATEYDIIIGHSDAKRKRAKRIVQRYKNE